MSDRMPGGFAREEIASQGLAWEQVIPLVVQQADGIRRLFSEADQVLCIGCGSGLNIAYCAASVLQMQTGIPAHAAAAADVYLFPTGAIASHRKTLGVLFSRSGKTTETLRAGRQLHALGMRTLAVTCDASSPLALESDLTLALAPVQEQAVVTTRSLTGMILAAQFVAAIVSGDAAYLANLKRLPGLCQTRMQAFQALGQRIGQRGDVQRYAFLGNGPFYGLAREGQLKLKEMAQPPCDAYHMLDFRHGPQSTVDEHTLVVAFVSDSGYRQEVEFLRDMRALGGLTWAVCEGADDALRAAATYVLELQSGLGELERLPLHLPAVQCMAYQRSLALGFDPDRPHNLTHWIDTSR
jgi:glucosamine--fructose-6-phosphate aminotransferase (isomerizing)